MKLLTTIFVAFFMTVGADEEFQKYDAAAVRRFEDELRRLGVALPSLSTPDEDFEKPQPAPKVTSAAGVFEGFWTVSQFGRPIASFEGIPYAQPPVGPLRFKVAQPAPRLTNFKANKPGPACTLRKLSGTSPKVEGQEDCLYINIHVPVKVQREESERLPVLFTVHGGGFVEGKGDDLKSNILLDKDVVLVTFNYRLGALGFLTTEDGVIPGNLGLKDQVAALRWVHENIAAFGGDPNLVTVVGHSAGGASTEHLLLSPLARGLFHRAIPMSGSTMAEWALAAPGETRRNLRKTAQFLDCPAEPSEDLLACLHTKSAQEIIGMEQKFSEWGMTPLINFQPVVEGDIPGAFLPYHPKKMFSDGLFSDVPCMTGLTSEEGSIASVGIFTNDSALREFDERFLELVPSTLFYTEDDKKRNVFESVRRAYFGPGAIQKSQLLQASNMYSDFLFIWPMVQSVQYLTKTAKAPTYVYYFNYLGSRSLLNLFGFEGSYGVSHGDDLFYLHPFPGTPNSADVRMSMVMTDLFTSFARDGVPSSSLLNTNWQPVKTKGTDFEYLHIKSPVDVQMKKNLLPERWSLLKRLLEGEQVPIRSEL